MANTNPFSTTYAAIWGALTAWSPWLSLVRPGNRLDAQDTRLRKDLMKAAQPGDFPEVRLLEAQFGLTPFGQNSLSCEAECFYPLQIATGTLEIDKLNQVVWESYRALINSGNDLGLPALVARWKINGNATVSTKNRELNRGTPGWSMLCTIDVQFNFNRKTVLTQ